ncbi:MAG: hypothetical protein DRI34_03070, partial [Deltaproteobacteria bacterium]
IDGLNSGDYSNGLSLRTIGYGCYSDRSFTTRAGLSVVGSLLYDSCGNVFNTGDMSLVEQLPFDQWEGWLNTTVIVHPGGRYLLYEGFAELYNQQNRVTDGGEGLLLLDTVDMSLVDLDGDPGNGLTGIDLPDANGWNGGGSYNGIGTAVTASGDKIYIATGGSGVVVVELGATAEGDIVPDHGGRDGEITVWIGGSYEPGSSVLLQRDGQADIVAIQVEPAAGGALQALFDLRDSQLGEYQLLVISPGGSRRQEVGAFTVEESRQAATLDMSGETFVRADGEARFRVLLQNTGNNDLVNPLVGLDLGADILYRLELPSLVPGGTAQNDSEFSETDPQVPEYLWLARLPAGRQYGFWVILHAVPGSWLDDAERQLEAEVFLLGDERVTRGLLGDACDFVDGIVTRLGKKLADKGYDVSDSELRTATGQAVLEAAGESGVKKLKGLAVGVLKKVVTVAIPEVAIVATAYDMVKDTTTCLKLFSKLFGLLFLFPQDPNDKVSSSGVDGYITPDQYLVYTIFFENKAEATAEARNVLVTDTIDSNLDLTSFELLDSSHPEVLGTSVDEATRTIEFSFSGINLPPNQTPPEGEGWLRYRIKPAPGLPSGSEIHNQAAIVFDSNDPILTSDVIHRVDSQPPSSTIQQLPEQGDCGSLVVSWTGSDQGVGVWDYTVYRAVDDGPPQQWLLATEQTSTTMEGDEGRRYSFYVVARDRLGNTEQMPVQPDAVTVCSSAAGGGCGCGTSSRSPALSLLGLLGLLLVLHRRRCS